MRVVFDLDGTLALNEHRVHFIRQEPKDYDAFFAACVDDAPNLPVIETLWAHLRAGNAVEIWSGRSDQVRRQTETWLHHHTMRSIRWHFQSVSALDLLARMRPAGDHQPDVDLKRGWLREARERRLAPDLVYDDRDSVVAMWREEGVTCFQVAPGPF